MDEHSQHSSKDALRSPHEPKFALVLLGDSSTLSPRTFMIPRDHLAATTWIQHMNRLSATTGTRRQPGHNPQPISNHAIGTGLRAG